jgi:citrate/tricarballylate utilization protein
MGVLLALHLGLVLGFFLVLPYSKMVHGAYRGLALLRNTQERRNAA